MASVPADSQRLVDGQYSFEKGVFGDRVRTIASQALPNGIPRSGLAWLVNGTVRGGGITQRTGWVPLVEGAPWSGLFQGAMLLQRDFADPYILMAVAGELWRVRVDTDNSVDNLSTLFGPGLTMPPTIEQNFFTQAELFAVWQAGDLVTNPIFFWDDGGSLIGMRRSNGFVGVGDPTNEIPAASCMDYAQQRLWYAILRTYIAGDISQNLSSGTAPFDYRDSVLHVTENPVAVAGDGFSVPTQAGNIRALKHTANLDSALGESQMFVFTRQTIYACTAPITRTAWTATTNNLQPLQKVVLTGGGTYAERSVVACNGDLFFNSPPLGDIRSLTIALRYFNQWGQVPLSRQENRILQFNDRALLRFASGCLFDNRVLQATYPVQTPAGPACQVIMPLDFDLVSTLTEREPPCWEGHWQGLQILQLLSGDFGGRERCFAIVWSERNQGIEVWEISSDRRFDRNASGEARVQWQIEFPAYTFGDMNGLKELDSLELEISKLLGTVEFKAEYRPDHFPCFLPWRTWKVCSAADCTQLMDDPCAASDYPVSLFCESFRSTMMLPKPQGMCIAASGRPSNIGFQFQVRLSVHGWCRVNSARAYAFPRQRGPYTGLVC